MSFQASSYPLLEEFSPVIAGMLISANDHTSVGSPLLAEKHFRRADASPLFREHDEGRGSYASLISEFDRALDAYMKLHSSRLDQTTTENLVTYGDYSKGLCETSLTSNSGLVLVEAHHVLHDDPLGSFTADNNPNWDGVIAEFGLETFYADLTAKQEPLGREFEQVLFENLWKLYAR